jgi:hypothetical protein
MDQLTCARDTALPRHTFRPNKVEDLVIEQTVQDQRFSCVDRKADEGDATDDHHDAEDLSERV